MVANHLLKIVAKGWLPGGFLEGTLTQTLSYPALTALCSPVFFNLRTSFFFQNLPNFPLFEQYVKPRFPDVTNSSPRWYKSNTLSARSQRKVKALAVENRSSLGPASRVVKIPASKSPSLQNPLGQKVVQKEIPSVGSNSEPLRCALLGDLRRHLVPKCCLNTRTQLPGLRDIPTAQAVFC